MTDTTHTQTREPRARQDEQEERRPDLKEAPESPPVDKYDLRRGEEQLDRVITK